MVEMLIALSHTYNNPVLLMSGVASKILLILVKKILLLSHEGFTYREPWDALGLKASHTSYATSCESIG
jgi:hypothetical protein